MTNTYKQVENELKKIVYDYITEEENKELKILIYYRNKKVKHLFIRNNMHQPKEKFNVVYKYSCDQVPCTEAQSCYIGYTTTRAIQATCIHQKTFQKSPRPEHYGVGNDQECLRPGPC